jgi:rhodanese-related sulfurtransferase
MEEFNDIIKEMDFDFFGSGEHGMSVEAMRHAIGNDHFLFLDVRTNEEVAHVSFPFAKHIPLEELPERLDELPKDKFIVAFCAAVFRGAIAFAYLRANGYEEVKGLTASLEDMVMPFKPGPLAQNKK